MLNCTFEDGGKGSLRHVVVHVLCVKDGKVLLVKRAERLLEGGKWGFPGGFLDRNETLPQCALRELMEETGYEGTIKGFFRVNSNPNRRNDDGRQNIAHEWLVEVGEKTGVMDDEQTAVEWHDIESLNEEMMAFDHFETIGYLKKYLKGELEIPLATP